MEQRSERIIVETDRHRITGDLALPADGYRSRLTDYLNASEREFIALSLRHVVLAMPIDGDAPGG